MNSLNYCLLITSSVLVLTLVDRTVAADKCLFGCLKGVIKCKREVKIPNLLPSGTDCCALYAACYMGCDPNATSAPKCKQNRKRGSWNKRTPVYMLSQRSEEPTSEFGDPEEPKIYYRDALSYLLAPTAADDLD